METNIIASENELFNITRRDLIFDMKAFCDWDLNKVNSIKAEYQWPSSIKLTINMPYAIRTYYVPISRIKRLAQWSVDNGYNLFAIMLIGQIEKIKDSLPLD